MTAIDAMENLSKSGGGGGGNPMLNAGMGLGMGGAMGNMFGNMMGNTMHQPHQQHPPQQPPPMTPNLFHYNGPSGQGQFSAQDIAQKIQANRSGSHNVWAAGWPTSSPYIMRT